MASSMDDGDQQLLMNFCLQPFVECVRSESVAADDHSLANLVAMPGAARSRGFRVEHYVRPPVSLALDLCVAVSVSCVLLCPDLPAQAELRLELSGSSVRGNDQFRLSNGEVVRGGEGEIVVVLKNPMSWKRGIAPPTVSSVAVWQSYVRGVLERADVQPCWLKASPALSCCRHLKVRISRWTGTRPVTVKWMEIWGTLAPHCSQEETKLFQTNRKSCGVNDGGPSSYLSKTTVVPIPHYFQSPDLHLNPLHHWHPDDLLSSHDLANTKQSPSLCSSQEYNSSGGGAGTSVQRSECVCSEGKVECAGGSTPARILDEITCEVMVMPMLLPSGHCVDQSTLNKLARADSACGRPPTDPFTGNLTILL